MRPVFLAASMEMNESSRWTEEEMETAKKGEAARPSAALAPWARVGPGALPRAGCCPHPGPQRGRGAGSASGPLSAASPLLGASVLLSRSWASVAAPSGHSSETRSSCRAWGGRMAPRRASACWPCRQSCRCGPGCRGGRCRSCGQPRRWGRRVRPSPTQLPSWGGTCVFTGITRPFASWPDRLCLGLSFPVCGMGRLSGLAVRN